jgi:hypothetical protein
MTDQERTKVAVLGTLAEFHREPIPYDLAALLALVEEINPDLLCLDLTPDQWQKQDFEGLPPEYQEALLPLAHQTDIVVVPIGGGQPAPTPEAAGWRGRAIGWLRERLAMLQRTAPGPAAINQGWRHELANYLYHASNRLAGEEVEEMTRAHTDQLTQATLETARRDPGTRILVVVNVQHCHHIRARLRRYDDIDVRDFREL